MIGHPLKVQELLDEVARSEVLLPEIQRAYVWKGPQVAKLIDSLYHEYPSGQILLWDTINLPITKNLEGVKETTLPSAGHPKIVLDGQQRLTSLYKALSDGPDLKGEEDGGRVRVYFNIETEQFQLYQKRLDRDPLWVSVRDIVTGKAGELALLQKIASSGGPKLDDLRSQEYLNRLKRLRNISQYKFPIEIFKSDDYEEVTELFVRINSAGTRLRAAELVLAQLALRLPGTLVEKFEESMDEYSDLGYELDSRFLTRAFIAIGTGQSRFRYLTEFWKKPPQSLTAFGHVHVAALIARSISCVRTPGSSPPTGCRPRMPSFLSRRTSSAMRHSHPTQRKDCSAGSMSPRSGAGTAARARQQWTRIS
jgi:hypothetical protein